MLPVRQDDLEPQEWKNRAGAGIKLVPSFQHLDESFLRDIDFPDGPSCAFPFLLLFQKLALAGHVTAVTFGGNVLAHGRDAFTGDDLAADAGLNGDGEKLAGNDVFQPFRQFPAAGGRLVLVNDHGEGVHRSPAMSMSILISLAAW